MKMIQVEDEIHEKAKAQAKEKGMLLKAYMGMLVEKAEKTAKKG